MGGGRVKEERGNHIKKVLIPLVARLNKKTRNDECPVVVTATKAFVVCNCTAFQSSVILSKKYSI